MSHQAASFPLELGIATRVGLTQGVGAPGLLTFGEAEMRYRENRMIADARRRRAVRRENRRRKNRAATGASRREGMSRWTTWLPSVPLLHRSSPAPTSSTACGS